MGEEAGRRLDELNIAIEVAISDLRKLVAERDRLEAELGRESDRAVTPGDPADGPPPRSAEDFVVPWAPEEEAL
ncbi:MAG: hypothetical protein KJO17_09835 [Acidimicrobiia bacterium]|nr:hypothetical protein [Acidimicrobiia bacterium]MBT8217135.1 hypothetical protein [Acidimicrobiia bacterium]NNL70497.1 hypothetical protein [Acidimicrobiia bacterium]